MGSGDDPLPGVITAAILELARRQHGALGQRQLATELGLSRSAVWRATRDGRLIVVAPGVYRLGSAADSFLFRCRASSLFADDCGFVSADSAGRIRGLRKMALPTVHFTVPAGFRRTPPRWMRLNYTRWYDGDADRETIADGVVVARPLRMLFGLAADFNQRRFDRAADDAWHLGLIEPHGVSQYLEDHRCRGKDGVARIEAWLERAMQQRAASQSYLERELIDAVERIGLPPPVRQHAVRLSDGEVIHLDAAWPELRFAVEPGHSWFHGLDGGQERDHLRDLGCGEIGWHVLRLNERLLADADAAARRIAAVYRRRVVDLAPPPSAA